MLKGGGKVIKYNFSALQYCLGLVIANCIAVVMQMCPAQTERDWNRVKK